MPAISFSVFKEQLLSQKKTQTIRQRRKHPIQVGDLLQIYWKQRSPTESQKLFNAKCTAKDSIVIQSSSRQIVINESQLSEQEAIVLATADGFDNLDDFFKFFGDRYGDSFDGDLIHFQKV
ncbi:MAG: hypothetical protein AAFO04_27050 [Cyanobacteria bacterium J06592_8]